MSLDLFIQGYSVVVRVGEFYPDLVAAGHQFLSYFYWIYY